MTTTRLKRLPDVVTIKGADGKRSATMISTGLLQCECEACALRFYVPSRVVEMCPACGHRKVKMMWTRPQTVLVPEDQSTFFNHKKPGAV
jgi:Zn finger protein HypA/HybF involved in hydrogenase expression